MEDSASTRSSEIPSAYAPYQRKRKRTIHACDTCRIRKIRCDGLQPCTSCSKSDEKCAYGSEAYSRSKNDLILDVTLRSEQLLRDMKSTLSSVVGLIGDASTLQRLKGLGDTFAASSPTVLSPISTEYSHRDASPIQNATMASQHTSSMESILAWPTFDALCKLHFKKPLSVFELEYSRPSLPEKASDMLPFAGNEDIDSIIYAFQKNANFWYPIVSLAQVKDVQKRALEGSLDNSISSCLALLVMSLGCAVNTVAKICGDENPDVHPSSYEQQQRVIGEMYFNGAKKIIHHAHSELNTESVQCLFLTGLFFAYLQRPLQAWSYVNAAATKCRLLLSYRRPNATSEDEEVIRRVFWSCYILESDYLAELSALPQSGISDIESTVALPGDFHTHANPHDEENASLYLLACISIRRLLNRVHHLLYAKENGASFDFTRFPSIVNELDHQLEEWRQLLPTSFQFTIDSQLPSTEQGAFLRQRYLTCRSVIYRPYLVWALSNYPSSAGAEAIPPNVANGCKICLDACTLHILNLRSYVHTVMIDTWICALSMASAMLILFAAYQNQNVCRFVPPEITSLGPQLHQLLKRWMHVPGQFTSPSVEQGMNLVTEINILIQKQYMDS